MTKVLEVTVLLLPFLFKIGSFDHQLKAADLKQHTLKYDWYIDVKWA